MSDKIVQHLREVAPHFEDAKPLMMAAAHRIEALQAERDAAISSRDEWKRGWYSLDQDTRADLSAARTRAETAEAERDAAVQAEREARRETLLEAADLAAFIGKDNFAPMVRSFDEAFSAACSYIERRLRARSKEPSQ